PAGPRGSSTPGCPTRRPGGTPRPERAATAARQPRRGCGGACGWRAAPPIRASFPPGRRTGRPCPRRGYRGGPSIRLGGPAGDAGGELGEDPPRRLQPAVTRVGHELDDAVDALLLEMAGDGLHAPGGGVVLARHYGHQRPRWVAHPFDHLGDL